MVGVHPSSLRSLVSVADQHARVVGPIARRIHDVILTATASAADQKIQQIGESRSRVQNRRYSGVAPDRALAENHTLVSAHGIADIGEIALGLEIADCDLGLATSPSRSRRYAVQSPDATKCGSWRGPKWLNDRATITVERAVGPLAELISLRQFAQLQYAGCPAGV